MGKKKLTIILSIILVLIVSSMLIFSYAYIKPNIIEINKTQTITKARELNLVYTGETEINESSILPGQSFEKTFNVENKNDVDTKFNIYIENILNEFNGDLVYTLIADDEIIIEEKELPITNSGKSYLLARINIEAGRKINYKLLIIFKNTEEDQTDYMGKVFSGTLGIDTDPNLEDCTKPEIASMDEWSLTENLVSLTKIGYSSSGVDYYEYYVTNDEDEELDEDTIPTGVTDDNIVIEDEGLNYVYYRTVAKSGLRSAWSSPVQTKIDTTPPTCTISGNPSSWVDSVNLSIVSYDSGSGLDENPYSWDGENYNTTLIKTITENGKYKAYVKDKMGNTNYCETTVSLIDKSDPSVSFGTNGNGAWVKSASTTVSVVDNESGVSSIKYYWSTSTTTPAISSFTSNVDNGGTVTGSGLTGVYYLWVLAYDVANHYTLTRTNAFYFDNTAPTCSIGINTTGWATGVRLTVYPSDATSGVSSNWNGNYYDTISNGWHTATVTDSAGNTNTCSYNVTNIDRTGPNKPSVALRLDSASGAGYASGSWTASDVWHIVSSSDSQSGIAYYQYSHDNVNWSADLHSLGWGSSYANGKNTLYYRINWSGQWNFFIRAVDALGNVSPSSDMFTVRIDKVTPSLSIRTGLYYNYDSTGIVSSVSYGSSGGSVTCYDTSDGNRVVSKMNDFGIIGNHNISCTARGGTGLTNTSTGTLKIGKYVQGKDMHTTDGGYASGNNLILPAGKNSIQYGPYQPAYAGCYRVYYYGNNLNTSPSLDYNVAAENGGIYYTAYSDFGNTKYPFNSFNYISSNSNYSINIGGYTSNLEVSMTNYSKFWSVTIDHYTIDPC